MRWLTVAALLFAGIASVASCRAPSPPDERGALLAEGRRYVDEPAFRRARLVAAQVNPENGYSRTQIARYDEARWGALVEWAPRTRPVRPTDLGQPMPRADDRFHALESETTPWRYDALIALGRRAFHEYPAQLTPAARQALRTADGPERFGLWRHGSSIGGLVFVDLPGGVQPALTCSTCHAAVRDGRLIDGLAHVDFDLGALLDAHRGARTEARRWGPGRVDVTPDRTDNATAIADLRPVRFQSHLNRTASVHNDPLALALRIETGIIATTGQARRPPRRVAFALALYLWSLADTLPPLPAGRGAEVFRERCGACHGGPGLTGAPRPIESIGTEDAVARSPVRTTGTWQVPALRGLGQRRQFFASGQVRNLPDVLAPPRGHAYAADLTETDRAALLVYLQAL